jgi:phosphomannomutase
VVCRDNKSSSASLKERLVKGLRSTGVKVIDIGSGPTDYAAYTGKKHGCISVQVTSSHMPLNFNGFKFMYPEGNGFVNEDLNEVKEIFRSGGFNNGEGKLKEMKSTSWSRYKDDLKLKAMRYSATQIDKKIVVDTMGGATRDILPELLRGLGAEVIDISDEKDEMPYRDPPNPKPDNLDELVEAFDEHDADLGIATDMDGDRATFYNGEFISGDEVFCLMSRLVSGDAVASIDTSEALEELVEDRGNEVFYTRVGDPFVMDKALEEKTTIAGEPNGHYSVLEFVPYNSGTLTALMIAGLDIESELNEVPHRSVRRDSIEVDDKHERVERLKKVLKDEHDIISEKDGVKAKIGYSNVLIRPSGSSPKLRVISEAADEDTAEAGLDEAKELIRNS